MYNIAICDDDTLFMERMKAEISSNAEFESSMSVSLYESGEELLSSDVEKISLVIIDMQMARMDGYVTAKELRKRNRNVLLSFCSGVIMPQPEHFEVQPYRYLIKPVDMKRLDGRITELLREMKERSYKNIVDIASDGQAWKVSSDDILYILRLKRGSRFVIVEYDGEHKKYKSLLSNERIEDWYDQLSGNGFEFAHISYIVNLKHVVSMVKDNIGMSNGEMLRVSRKYMKTFSERYSHYFSKKYKRN